MIHQFSVNELSHAKRQFDQEYNDGKNAYSKLASIIAELNQCSMPYCVVVKIIPAQSLNDHKKTIKQFSSLIKSLTKREYKVFDLSMKGLTTKLISEHLGITVETVKSHRKKIVSKAGVSKIEEIKNWITSGQLNL